MNQNGNISKGYAPLILFVTIIFAMVFARMWISGLEAAGTDPKDVALAKAVYELTGITIYAIVLSVVATWIIFWIYDLSLVQKTVFPGHNEINHQESIFWSLAKSCLLYTSPSPRDS